MPQSPMSVLLSLNLSISEVRGDTEMASATVNIADKAISHYKNPSFSLVFILSHTCKIHEHNCALKHQKP